VSALGILCVFAGIHLGLIHLRRTEPHKERAFRVPLAVQEIPLPAALGLVTCAGFATQFEPTVYAVFAGALVLGLLLYAIARRR
jgi:APA family basic amino acid/polyamine antiporter